MLLESAFAADSPKPRSDAATKALQRLLGSMPATDVVKRYLDRKCMALIKGAQPYEVLEELVVRAGAKKRDATE